MPTPSPHPMPAKPPTKVGGATTVASTKVSADGARLQAFRWQSWLVVLVFALSLGILLYSVYAARQQHDLAEGKPSPNLYKSPIDLQVIDPIATERVRQAARLKVEPVYRANEQATTLVQEAIDEWELLDAIKQLVAQRYYASEGVDEAARAALLDEVEALVLSQELDSSDGTEEAGGQAGDLGNVLRILERDLLITSEEDIELTQALRETAAQNAEPIYKVLQAGETIVREGTILTAEHLRVLEAVGFYAPRSRNLLTSTLKIASSLFMALLLSAILFYSMQRAMAPLRGRQQIFLLALLLLQLVVQRLLLLWDTGFLLASLLPMVIAVVVSQGAAVMLAVWLAMVLGLLIPESGLLTVLVSGLTSLGAVVSMRWFSSRSALLFAGCIGGALAGLSLVLYTLMTGTFEVSSLVAMGWLVVGGLLSGVLALGLITVAESLLGFVTEFHLLELSNPSSPLLERLLIEAPGTYQHSLTIANLIEPAVASIGGNALLARVGALYHDVGKLQRPQFFVENQFSGHNPHDALSPHLSHLIITSHVRDGIKLLREYTLPDILDPFVQQHHGTTLLSYFYKRALEENPDVDEMSFRYAGPKPQSKEVAVLMIADAVESASRTLEEPSQGSVRALIDRIIKQRTQDNQFAESPLNLHDLEVVASSFERTLMAILHRRIRYPSEDDIKNLKRSQANQRAAAKPKPSNASKETASQSDAARLQFLPTLTSMPNPKKHPSASDVMLDMADDEPIP